jgi:hypothetical protein
VEIDEEIVVAWPDWHVDAVGPKWYVLKTVSGQHSGISLGLERKETGSGVGEKEILQDRRGR